MGDVVDPFQIKLLKFSNILPDPTTLPTYNFMTHPEIGGYKIECTVFKTFVCLFSKVTLTSLQAKLTDFLNTT